MLFTDSFHAFFSSFRSPTVILNMYCFATVKKGFVFLLPRLRALFLLNKKAPKGSSRRIEGRKRDDKGAGDPKSEKEIFSRFFEDLTIAKSILFLFPFKSSSIHTICNLFFDRKLLIYSKCLNISQVCIHLRDNHIMDIACLYTMAAWSIFQADAVFL